MTSDELRKQAEDYANPAATIARLSAENERLRNVGVRLVTEKHLLGDELAALRQRVAELERCTNAAREVVKREKRITSEASKRMASAEQGERELEHEAKLYRFIRDKLAQSSGPGVIPPTWSVYIPGRHATFEAAIYSALEASR